MRSIIFLLMILAAACSQKTAETKSPAEIMKVLDDQVSAWNAGDIDRFMQGYWKSDSVQFIGSSRVLGWTATLERYKKSYPDRDAMGILRFDILEMQWIDPSACLITGRYHLTRKSDNPEGIFTLLFKKIDGAWVIVYDHTS